MAASSVRLPQPFADIARCALMYPYPTAIEPLKNLTSHLSQQAQKRNNLKIPNFWIKHEDTNSALAYGGNKVRKLEYVIADAIKKRATHLVTVGGVQSNSQRQVAAAGNRYGMKTILTPNPEIGNPSSSDCEAYSIAGNVQVNSILGAMWYPSTPADSEQARSTNDLAYEIAAFREMDRIKSEGGNPYFIPSGASLHPLGGLGFARWAFELEQQEREMGVWWDAIVVACASGSTLGGMVAGFKLSEQDIDRKGGKRRLLGIQATSCDLQETSRVVTTSAKNTARLIGLSDDDITEKDFELVAGYNGGSYGYLDQKTQEAIKLLATTEGILTDPVYTGKAVAGLIGIAQEGGFQDAENVLFIHTGGTAALPAYPSMR